MYSIQPEDNIVITGDTQNHDDIVAIPMMLLNFDNVRAICITNGAWTNIGASIEIINNLLLAVLKIGSVRLYQGSAKSSTDEQYDTLGTFNNIIDQKEQADIDNLYGSRSYLTNIISSVKDILGEELDLGITSRVAGNKEDFYKYAKSLPNLVIISLGSMTDVVPIISDAKAVIQQGGRFYNPNIPPSFPKINPGASSNIYLDPSAARKSLISDGQKIWWVFSDAVVDVRTTQDTVDRLNSINTDNPLYNRFLKVLAMYYQGIVNDGIDLAVSDATLPILLKYPELATEVERGSIDIVDSVSYIRTETDSRIFVTVSYDKRIGSMIDGPYQTNLVQKIDSARAIPYFYQMLSNTGRICG